MSKRFRKLAWAGFENGKVAELDVDMGWGGYGTGDLVTIPMTFLTRKAARQKFQDVRRIEIREVRPARRAPSQGKPHP